jgi:hypothetical protein
VQALRVDLLINARIDGLYDARVVDGVVCAGFWCEWWKTPVIQMFTVKNIFFWRVRNLFLLHWA